MGLTFDSQARLWFAEIIPLWSGRQQEETRRGVRSYSSPSVTTLNTIGQLWLVSKTLCWPWLAEPCHSCISDNTDRSWCRQHMVMVASAAKPRPSGGYVAHWPRGDWGHRHTPASHLWLSHSDGVGGIIVPITVPFLFLIRHCIKMGWMNETRSQTTRCSPWAPVGHVVHLVVLD